MKRLRRFLWRGKLRKAATVVVGSFVVLVVIGAIASAFEEDDKTSTPPASSLSEMTTPGPTETAESTAMPEQTNTPTKLEECEKAGGRWHNHYFSFKGADCHPATPTPEPTETGESTEMPEPTKTPTEQEECEEAGGTWHNHYFSFRDADCHPATPTPEPTETPEPIAPQGPPELTTAECAYLEILTDQSEDVTDALARLGELFSTPQLFSDEWILDAVLQLVIIRVAYAEASALDPPASLQAVHAAYMDGMSKWNDATFLVIKGVDNLDPDQFLEAADLMSEGGEDIERATELFLEFGVTRSGFC